MKVFGRCRCGGEIFAIESDYEPGKYSAFDCTKCGTVQDEPQASDLARFVSEQAQAPEETH